MFLNSCLPCGAVFGDVFSRAALTFLLFIIFADLASRFFNVVFLIVVSSVHTGMKQYFGLEVYVHLFMDLKPRQKLTFYNPLQLIVPQSTSVNSKNKPLNIYS